MAPSSRRSAGQPMWYSAPATVAATPLPVRARWRTESRPPAPRAVVTMPRVMGCSDSDSTPAAMRSASSSGDAFDHRQVDHAEPAQGDRSRLVEDRGVEIPGVLDTRRFRTRGHPGCRASSRRPRPEARPSPARDHEHGHRAHDGEVDGRAKTLPSAQSDTPRRNGCDGSAAAQRDPRDAALSTWTLQVTQRITRR